MKAAGVVDGSVSNSVSLTSAFSLLLLTASLGPRTPANVVGGGCGVGTNAGSATGLPHRLTAEAELPHFLPARHERALDPSLLRLRCLPSPWLRPPARRQHSTTPCSSRCARHMLTP